MAKENTDERKDMILTILNFDKNAEFQYVDNFKLKNFSHPLLSIEEPWYSMKYDSSFDWLMPVIKQIGVTDFYGADNRKDNIWICIKNFDVESACKQVAEYIKVIEPLLEKR